MRTRTSHRLLFALAVLIGLLPFAPFRAAAQPASAVSGSPSVPGARSPIETVLQHGMRLETERRWQDALAHYESALRNDPGRPELEQRLDAVRVRMDVARRYADTSFVDGLRGIGARDALELYDEILAKIQTHHVQAPDWRQLYLHGLATFEAALDEPCFLAANPNVHLNETAALRGELHGQAVRFRIRDRRDAHNAAAYCAQWAEQKIGVPGTSVVLEFTSGAVGALDEYSSFLTGDQLDEVFAQIEGNFVGLGVELKSEDGELRIVNVIAGGPAEDAGIRVGERIVAVDGRPTRAESAESAADLLKGPEGSRVELVVRGIDGQERRLGMARRRVEVACVDRVSMLDTGQGVGYLRLTSFQKSTSRDVDNALWQLHRQGMRALIVDLRGNPGGLLSAAVDLADKFMAQGGIVSTRGRSAGEDYDYRAHAAGTWQLPLVVLIDGDSASASEIFAGAIHDSRRGVVVGQRSFGKGSVQGIFPLQAARAGVRLTTAKFYSPSGQPISKRGVAPDVVVQSVAKPADGAVLDERDDPVLRAGLQTAREQFTQR